MSTIYYNTLLKISQVAERLQISRTGAYRLCESGHLPSVRFGSTVRVRPEDLENFIATHLHVSTLNHDLGNRGRSVGPGELGGKNG